MRTGAASAVGAVGCTAQGVIMAMGLQPLRHHNENDVTMTIAGLWRYGDWRHVAMGYTL